MNTFSSIFDSPLNLYVYRHECLKSKKHLSLTLSAFLAGSRRNLVLVGRARFELATIGLNLSLPIKTDFVVIANSKSPSYFADDVLSKIFGKAKKADFIKVFLLWQGKSVNSTKPVEPDGISSSLAIHHGASRFLLALSDSVLQLKITSSTALTLPSEEQNIESD